MKIIIAMDSFKGTLSSRQACQIIENAFARVNPAMQIITRPIADGGEGTAETMLAAIGGQWIKKEVMGPLADMRIEAGFAWFEKTQTALVEMAAASGITLLSKDKLNPQKTTTYGTGELIMAALGRNPKRIFLAVGGSATVDGGIGAAMATGWKFLDDTGKAVGLGGAELIRIAQIIPPTNLKLPPIEVLSDVTNPLTGPRGAACVFGPQKGATPRMVEQLDAALKHLALLVKAQLHIEIDCLPGAGAAGGLAAGAIAFMNAKIVSGIETIIEASGIANELADADWLITGEGCLDSQSLDGKAVSGIIKIGLNAGVNIGVLAGNIKLSHDDCRRAGITDTLASCRQGMSLDYALANAEQLLTEAAVQFAKKHFLREV